MADELLATVVYTGEPDEVFEFSAEGQGRLFGRDDGICDIVIWSAINSIDLSRIAGRIWRMDGELWIRNLSTTHELQVVAADSPPGPPLPPRRDDVPDPGPARSIPGPTALVTAPGGCELLVSQLARPEFPVFLTGIAESTFNLPPVPPDLRPVAIALCEPILRGAHLPAAYSEVTRRAGTGSLKRTRNLVARLCALYTAEVPALGPRGHERRRAASASDDPAQPPRLRAGVWTFAPTPEAEPGTPDGERRRSLNLPDYYEVAHLLVRRRLVTSRDVQNVGEQAR